MDPIKPPKQSMIVERPLEVSGMTESISFIEQTIPSSKDIFRFKNPPVKFDKATGRFVPVVEEENREIHDCYLEAFEAASKLLKTQDAFNLSFKKLSKSKLGATLILRETLYFHDTGVFIQEICERLKGGKSGKSKSETSMIRKLGSAYENFGSNVNKHCIVQFLPQSLQFEKLLCGCLNSIFTAADAIALPKAMYYALQEIPGVLINEVYADIKADIPLHRLLSTLCLSILETLEWMLRHLLRKEYVRFASAFMDSMGSEEQLSERVAVMQSRSQQAQDQALVRKMKVLDNTEVEKERLSTMLTAQAAQNSLLVLLEDLLKDHTWKQERLLEEHKKMESQLYYLQQVQPLWVNVDQIFYDFQYQRELIARDCQNLAGYARSLSREELQKIPVLTNHVRLQTFIGVGSSFVLLLNGASRSQYTPRSAVSFVSEKLVNSLLRVHQRTGSICVIAYFCGKHYHPEDEYSDPFAMLKNLVLQLIDQYRGFSRDLLNTAVETIRGGDWKAVSKLLKQLVQSISTYVTVFCVIDGIIFFQSPNERMTKTTAVIRRLLKLSRAGPNPGPVFKVLFTTPAKCLDFGDLFETYETWTLLANSYPRGRPGVQHWRSSGIGSSLSTLNNNMQPYMQPYMPPNMPPYMPPYTQSESSSSKSYDSRPTSSDDYRGH